MPHPDTARRTTRARNRAPARRPYARASASSNPRHRPTGSDRGPEAGKTRTLTDRIACLLESEQARPDRVLAVTFSARAAGELRLRLADRLAQE
jgi:UvrD/REP helicase N-terminal domain